MGLPIWKDPDEEKRKQEAGKIDPTAAARSPIRRRPSVHGRRNTRLAREPTYVPSRLAGSPPPATRYNGSRSSRRSSNPRVPPVSTLLESADRRSAVPPPPPPPPPRVEAPNDYGLPVVTGERLRNVLEEMSQERQSATRHTPWAEAATSVRARLEERMRRSPIPQPNEEYLSAPRTRFVSRDNTPFHRSPEPMSAADQAESLRRAGPGRSNLPTPPLEQPDDSDSLFVPEHSDIRRPRTIRSMHPLSNSWRPESPINGLGDRNRSPTPADGWEIMQTTITPDISLPSADSSFTSAAASQSFTSNETALTEPDREPLPRRRSPMHHDSDSESDTSELNELDGVMGDADEREATAQYAQDMYYYEASSEDGRSRIEHHRTAFAEEGNKFALANESTEIELGFRLIDEALNSHEGRRRVFEISQHQPQASRTFEDWIFSSRRDQRRRRREQSPDDEDDDQPCPQPDRRTTSEEAAREANAQVHNYFRRFAADSLTNSHRASPPPHYEALASHPPDVETFISHDPPEPHPVSPPSARSQNEVGDLLLSGDEQDLNAVRRVVERLAQRDDVPDEWWMSMGLNLSRTRVGERSRSPARRSATERSIGAGVQGDGQIRSPVSTRVRTGRVERSGGGSRL